MSSDTQTVRGGRHGRGGAQLSEAPGLGPHSVTGMAYTLVSPKRSPTNRRGQGGESRTREKRVDTKLRECPLRSWC